MGMVGILIDLLVLCCPVWELPQCLTCPPGLWTRMQSDQGFNASAVLHLGMHGTVEWLPGASLGNTGLSWSDVLLGK